MAHRDIRVNSKAEVCRSFTRVCKDNSVRFDPQVQHLFHFLGRCAIKPTPEGSEHSNYDMIRIALHCIVWPHSWHCRHESLHKGAFEESHFRRPCSCNGRHPDKVAVPDVSGKAVQGRRRKNYLEVGAQESSFVQSCVGTPYHLHQHQMTCCWHGPVTRLPAGNKGTTSVFSGVGGSAVATAMMLPTGSATTAWLKGCSAVLLLLSG